MLVLPAVDILKGQAVRLYEGRPEEATVYFQDPVEAALFWQERGARMLHLVDLDRALGRGENLAALRRVAQSLRIPFQVGGGIRSLETLQEVLDLGAARAVVGTVALKDPPLLERMLDLARDRLALALDARGGEVVVAGWQEGSGRKVEEVLAGWKDLGVKTVIFTDVSRDGTLKGLDLEAVARVREAWPFTLIAGGGVASEEDLLALKALGVDGALVGKALYEGRIDLGRWR
ncbi:1-(5-phosphoribosyl)-5-[(5-phosphoribosylamino)methylideneamino]imidazole-4-carboxamide isomerase [Thermus filiformis]|uniref:1-(5-phosphoribosyl)-5-[(5-phosphoribosylamino)methylideneamino] imidazole-4-carboxamide isomerase n=1 Tax=Thermus filiformis TaxID=276 RepID=A0A0A2X6W6_THEFI|nr:1-(5-phosphoribosyl)-5-[(5-phosphoribosylamino)methylideneamino]imidazole-4-carboxamide isomerase [Thermus filiformis]KGQ20984.1 1-(5-phosphoribosyl)-5-[(5-phosphoribosylamino)methylideneamino] imidazole-4-carboxamide isomerase [Thermus filiformis]